MHHLTQHGSLAVKTRRTEKRRSILAVIYYVVGSAETQRLRADRAHPADVTVNPGMGVWYFRKGTRHEGSFKIGTDIRKPTDGEEWGPMMVYDRADSEQTEAVRKILRQRLEKSAS